MDSLTRDGQGRQQGQQQGRGRDNKARAGSKAASLRAVPLEAPAQDSVMEPTAEDINNTNPGGGRVGSVYDNFDTGNNTPRGALQYSPITLHSAQRAYDDSMRA